MSNPNPSIPSESDIAAAEEAANQALAALEELRKQREAAEQAATNKAALMAAFEAALSTGRFALVNGELIDAHASRGLTDDEKFILALARNGRLKVTELAGTKVVLDEALGSAQKSGDPKLTDDEKLLLEWARSGRVRVTVIEGQQYALDRTLSRQRAEARRRKEAAKAATSSAPTASQPGPSDPQAQQPTVVAPASETPVVANQKAQPRRRVARGSSSPSATTAHPYRQPPTWDEGPYGPPDYVADPLEDHLLGTAEQGYPPQEESSTTSTPAHRPGRWSRFKDGVADFVGPKE